MQAACDAFGQDIVPDPARSLVRSLLWKLRLITSASHSSAIALTLAGRAAKHGSPSATLPTPHRAMTPSLSSMIVSALPLPSYR